jgi:inner membrane protein
MLTLLMAWAVSYINTLILERQQRNNAVKQDIANSSAGEQTIIGPILVIPYIEEYKVLTTENNITTAVKKRDELRHFILPDNLELEGGFSNQIKKLGIYKALMYQLGGSFKGSFKLPANLNIKPQHDDGVVSILPAYVSIGISDPRGIGGKPEFIWNGQPLGFAQGSQITSLGNGIHVAIGKLDNLTEKTIPFNFKLDLHGMENFNFVPIAENNTVALQSSWRHPHFSGSFLPDPGTQSITPAGFSAQWAVSSLSSSNQALLINNLANPTKGLNLESLRIGFVEPINVYSQADRATKYGLLFIGLTFAGFFIFEILKRLRIHPAQYTLVGLAMALFYLLLISLSEHISFAMSYLAASLACISLLGYYLTYVLGGKSHGFIFAGLLTSLYGALYTILDSEDNALLMGSVLVFGLLAITMVVTRKVDWYQISTKAS